MVEAKVVAMAEVVVVVVAKEVVVAVAKEAVVAGTRVVVIAGTKVAVIAGAKQAALSISQVLPFLGLILVVLSAVELVQDLLVYTAHQPIALVITAEEFVCTLITPTWPHLRPRRQATVTNKL
jgi:hypothetical protein